jgi:hypothetical protein
MLPFFTTAVSAKPQAERTDVKVTENTSIAPGSSYNYSYQKSLIMGNSTSEPIGGVYGKFQTNRTISFFICNSSTFEKWNGSINESQGGIYLYQKNVSSYAWAFPIPYNDTWYIIFDNNNSQTVNLNAMFGIHTTPPVVALMGVYMNETVSGTITLKANATGSYFNVTSMYIFIDASEVASSSSDHVSYVWDTTKYIEGGHYIDVIAKDQMGLYGGGVTTVIVDNTPPTDLTPFLIIGGVAVVVILAASRTTSSKKKRRKRIQEKYHDRYLLRSIPQLIDSPTRFF